MIMWSFRRREKSKRACPYELVKKRPDLINDPYFIAHATLDTLLPHARNPSPFSTYEFLYYAEQWATNLSEEDRKAFWAILERNPGKRPFNGSKTA